MNLFEVARQLLESAYEPNAWHNIDRVPYNVTQVARELLAGLGYMSSGTPQQLDGALQNRLALLGLAARFDRSFQLPMRHSPGVVFFGGTVSPAAFGIQGHGDTVFGVGGRGETFRQAFESCVGEAAERLSMVEWDNDPAVMPAPDDCGLSGDELRWALGSAGLDPDSDLSRSDWIEAHSLTDDRPVWLPSELVLRRPENRRRGTFEAESSGVGAGPTRGDAIMSGLLECIERDAVALWWFGGRPACQPEPDVLRHPDLVGLVHKSRVGSSRPVWLLDISSEIPVPVFAALSSEPNGQQVITGFAADPDPHTAARKAFLEMCQMELAQEISVSKLQYCTEDKLSCQDRQWIERYRNLNTKQYPRLVERSEIRYHKYIDPIHRKKTTLNALDAHGFTAYVADLSRPQLKIPVIRTVIPALQSAKPFWISPRLASSMQVSSIPSENMTLI